MKKNIVLKMLLIFLMLFSSAQSIMAETEPDNEINYNNNNPSEEDILLAAEITMYQFYTSLENYSNVPTDSERRHKAAYDRAKYILGFAEYFDEFEKAEARIELEETNMIAKTHIYIYDTAYKNFYITKYPNKIYYYVGETLNLDGSRMLATRIDGTTIDELTIVPDMSLDNLLMTEDDYGDKIYRIKWGDAHERLPVKVLRYRDVHATHEFYPMIEGLSKAGIVKGYQDGSENFGINDPITRAEFAAMLARMHRKLYPWYPDFGYINPPPFTDIPLFHWAITDLDRLKRLKLISGYENGTFKPNNKITRAELAKMIGRLDGIEFMGDDPSFTDVSPTHWAKEEIYALYSLGIIKGFSPTIFGPNRLATRGQVAKIMWNTYLFLRK